MPFEFGEFSLDDVRCELRRRGEPVRVQRKVFDFLSYLIRHRDRLVTKEELLENVWGGTAVSEASLSRTMAHVRRALGDRVRDPVWVATIHGRGYRFIGDLHDAPTAARTEEPPSGADPEAGGRPDPRRVLAGRTRERGVLQEALTRARSGSGGLLLLEGEAGIGKSRLLEWAAEEASRRGFAAIVSQCREDEGAPALLPWIDLLRQLLEDAPSARSEAALERAGPALLRLCPELFPEGASETGPPGDPNASPFQGRAAVSALLAELASGQPLVLLLDDLHRADPSSVAMLEFLIARLARSPILFVASARPGAETDGLVRIARDPRCVTLSMEGLSEEEVLRILEAAEYPGCSSELAARVWEHTGGNAFFVHQVIPFLAAFDAETETGTRSSFARVLPQTVRKAVERGCAVLSESTRRLLQPAAVLGREFSAPTLAEVAQTSLPRVMDGLDEAVQARLLSACKSKPLRFRFAHLLVRDVLYEEIPSQRRAELHWTVAVVLEGTSSPAAELSAELAHHFEASATPEGLSKAIQYHDRAGERAARRLASDSAVWHYRRALDLLESSPKPEPGLHWELVNRLAQQTRLAHSRAEARALWLQATEEAQAMGDRARLGQTLLDLLGAYEDGTLGGVERLTQLLEEAVQDDSGDDVLRARLLARLAQLLDMGGQKEAAERAAVEAAELARQTRHPLALVESLTFEHIRRRGTPDAAARASIAEELIQQAVRAGQAVPMGTFQCFRASDLAELGRFWECDEQIAAFARLAEQTQSPEAMAVLWRFRAMRALMSGDLAEARTHVERGLRLARHLEPSDLLLQGIQLASIEWEAGGPWYQMVPRGAPGLLTALADLRAHQELGEPERVAQGVEYLLGGTPARAFWFNDPVHVIATIALGVAYVKNVPRARELHEFLSPFEEQHVLSKGSVYCGPVRRYLGLLEFTLGRPRKAFELVEAALEASAAVGARPCVARIHLDLVDLHAQTSAADRAAHMRRHAHDALEVARSVGMARVEERARRVLEEVGSQGPGPV